jgi:hypothetical protein
VRRLARSPLLGYSASAAAGLAIGTATAYGSFTSHTGFWLVWWPLAAALTAAAGIVCVYGLRRWHDLQVLKQTKLRDVVAPVLLIAVFGVGGVASPDYINGLPGSKSWSGVPVVVATLLAAPAAAVMYGVRNAASSPWPSLTRGGEVALLIALRRLLERLLAAVGALVALATLQKGALLTLQHSVGSQAGTQPVQFILVFGAFGSLLAGLVYVPAWAALRDRGVRLCDELLSLDCLTAVPEILSTAADRQKLEHILGADRSVLADLQSGLAILAPLLAGAVVAFFPH